MVGLAAGDARAEDDAVAAGAEVSVVAFFDAGEQAMIARAAVIGGRA